MTTRIALALFLVAGGVLAQDPPKGKCATCTGSKQVKCFSCDGKNGSQVPCPTCPESGFKCPGCQGAGTLMCVSCGGGGQASADQVKCAMCGGDGKLDCLLCDKGTVPCLRCKGDGKVSLECPTCSKTGHLRCPDCTPYSAAESCPACTGTKQEKCLACGGQGEQPKPCDMCRGFGKQACPRCYGHGKDACVNCGGAGKYHKSGNAGDKAMSKCDECGGKGGRPCSVCKGKGVDQCAQCRGKGGSTTPCWWCAGTRSIPCRRCIGETRCWTGRHVETGVVVTILPCQDLEPQFSLALKEAASLADYRVWRVILDGREASAPLQVGGADGWSVIGVTPSETEAATLDTANLFAPEMIAALSRKLPSWGAQPDAFQAPAKVAPKQVLVRLIVSDRALGTDAKAFRLRMLSDTTKVFECESRPLTVDGWVSICVGAARAGKK